MVSTQQPYGGKLIDLLIKGDKRTQLLEETNRLVDLILTSRQLCDIEMLINGGFSPLVGFMNKETYDKVVEESRLPNGLIWTIPITLDVSAQRASQFSIGQRLALRDIERNPIGVITIESIWEPDKKKEAELVFGSPDDLAHPSISYIFNEAGSHYIGGPIEGLQLPPHYDYTDLRYSPAELRQKIGSLGWTKLVGFQTRNPMHRSHRELTVRAAREAGANLLIHPVVGMTKPGDVDHYTRVRCYKELMNYYPPDTAMLSLLPLAMRMAGPKECVWHSIIRKNYGCTHFIVGRDHAGPGDNSKGQPFYEPYAAQELILKHNKEIGIEILTYQMVVYVEDIKDYKCVDEVDPKHKIMNISGTELRSKLFAGSAIPEWFSYPSVVALLRATYPPRLKQGFTLFFTGLSGAGKSTVANAVRIALLEEGSRPVTLLDGDEVRTHLSTELGFSKEHRELNIRRISYVASTITKSRGVAVTAAISPYRQTREYARKLISPWGGFFEIYINTSLDICEKRDRKGLYSKARQGLLKNFTGIDDPYEPPLNPEITLDTSVLTVRESVAVIFDYLRKEGFLM